MVYRVSPLVAVNASLTQQTFVSASYQLSVDYIEDRPGDKTLDSHDVSLRLAHAFRPGTTVDFTESFQISRNPASLLAGVPLNTDQSFKRNQFDGRFDHALNERFEASLKARIIDLGYDNNQLAANLDRQETLFGLSGKYSVLPQSSLVGEVRHQTISYDAGSASKDKDSLFLLVGVDYSPGPKLTTIGRIGWERRDRDGERTEEAPYAELSSKYDYGQLSFVAVGYSYALEETSNVDVYTDTQVHRMFVNLQHALSPVLVASGSFTYEPATLQGRRNISPDRDETTHRVGAAITYLARRNWSMSGTLDYDSVDSEDLSRDMQRTRVGLNARYSF